jgi:hypothetical protein
MPPNPKKGTPASKGNKLASRWACKSGEDCHWRTAQWHNCSTELKGACDGYTQGFSPFIKGTADGATVCQAQSSSGGNLWAPFPGYACRGLAHRVGELDGDRHIRMASHRFKNVSYASSVVGPETEIVRTDPPLGQHRCGFDNKKASAREGQVAEMDRVPVGRAALFGRILAHRRNHDAIAKFERANLVRRE